MNYFNQVLDWFIRREDDKIARIRSNARREFAVKLRQHNGMIREVTVMAASDNEAEVKANLVLKKGLTVVGVKEIQKRVKK